MTNQINTDVCIIGGGPAGLTLALELVRKNLRVVVLEQSPHYHRSFRGEFISPDSVCLLDQIGILDKIREHELIYTQTFEVVENNHKVLDVDFNDFKYDYKFPINVPQPLLLEALLAELSQYESFKGFLGTQCNELISKGDAIVGAKCRTSEGVLEIHAGLTVGADGRYSRARELSKLQYQTIPLERDGIWFKLPLPPQWQKSTCRVRILRDHHALLLPTYPNMLRVGFNIPKGSLQKVKQKGIEYLYEIVAELEPDILPDVKEHIKSWADTSMLDIFTTIVPTWYKEGFVLIGDAAHTLTPILGQGVNHAIIDAITLAPIVSEALKENPSNPVKAQVLQKFQNLREQDIERVRGMQLRQEKIFAASSNLTTFLRRTAYRLINVTSLKRLIWTQVYYQHQSQLLKNVLN
jgi:2-polyprenyl-6-methoxyphenol hydroxylase-like FAD-dependent oxidoreductase